MVTADYEDLDEDVAIDAGDLDDEFLDSEFDELMDEGLSLCGRDDCDYEDNGKGSLDKRLEGEGVVERIVEITFAVESHKEPERTTDDWPVDWDPSE